MIYSRGGRPNGVIGAWSAIEDKVGARSADENLDWSVERRFVIFFGVRSAVLRIIRAGCGALIQISWSAYLITSQIFSTVI